MYLHVHYKKYGATYVTDGIFMDNIVLILSTCTLGMVGLNFYTTNNKSFRANNKTQTKEGATLIFLFSIYVLSLLGNYIDTAWGEIIRQMPDVSTLGLLLVISRLAVNNLVPNWNYFDKKSNLVYALGVFLVIYGYVF